MSACGDTPELPGRFGSKKPFVSSPTAPSPAFFASITDDRKGFSLKFLSAWRYVTSNGSYATTCLAPRDAKYNEASPTFIPMSQTTTGPGYLRS
jgi:hypothetical protein